MPGSRTEFRESGDFTGRRLARSRVFSIRLIPDWKVRAVLGSFLFFRLFQTESRDAKRGGQGAQSRRRVSRICDFFGGKAPRGNEQTRSRSFLEIRARPRANARTRVTMPLIYAFVARGPTVLAEHTSHSGNFATVAAEVRPVSSFRLVGERLGATRRATTRLEAFPTRATRSDRRARPENGSRLEGVDASVSRTTATSTRVPRRPPAEDGGGAKRPFASVFFATDSDQISSLSASPARACRRRPCPR